MPGMPALPPFDWHVLATHWTLHPGWVIAGVVLLLGYLYAVHRARTRGAHVHWARIGCWVAGVVLLELTLASAIDTYAMSAFWIHMIEHLILIMVVPALLVCGGPLAVVAGALPERGRSRLVAALRSRPVAVVTHPLVGMVLYGAVIVATHLTSFMDQMAMHPWLMTFEQVLYLVSGWLMLLTLVGHEPIRWRVPYLFRIGLLMIGMVPDTIVGIVLMQADKDPFPVFMAMHPAWAPPPLRDVQIGGALMWVGGDGLMMCFAVGVVVAMISAPGRQAQVIGPWLESVRRHTLTDRLSESGAQAGAEASDAVDPDSEEARAAYNRMLERLNRGG